MDTRQFFAAVFHVHVGHDHAAFQGAGSVQGRRGDDVGELVGLHLRQQVAHSARLKLENPFGLTALQQCERGLVLELLPFDEVGGIDLNPAMLFDVLDRLVEDRQVAEAEEVHLQQSGLLDRRAFPLRDDVGLAGDRLQRDVLRDRFIRHHDARRVRSRTPREALNLFGQIEDLFDLRIGLIQRLEFRALLDRFIERDVQRLGDHLRDDIHILRRDGEGACDIADRRLGLQRPERANLRDVC